MTSSGEKIPPDDLEQAIGMDPLVNQVMVVGENRPFITALVVVNPLEWEKLCESLSLDPTDAESFRSQRCPSGCDETDPCRNPKLPNLRSAGVTFTSRALPGPLKMEQ